MKKACNKEPEGFLKQALWNQPNKQEQKSDKENSYQFMINL